MRKIVLCLMVMWVGAFSQSAIGKSVATKVAYLPIAQKRNSIWGLAFSPDNVHLAVGAGDKLEIWDWRRQTVEFVQQPPGSNPEPETRAIQYSPDGKLLALIVNGDDNLVVRVFDTRQWDVEKDFLSEGSGMAKAIAFTKDGKFLLVVKDQLGAGDTLLAYNRETWRQEPGLNLGRFRPEFLGLSPDGKHIAISGHLAPIAPPSAVDQKEWNGLYRWKPLTHIVKLPQLIDEHELHGDARGVVAWSADSSQVVIIGNEYSEMFDARTSVLRAKLKDEKMGHTASQFTLDGRYFINSDANGLHTGKGIQIWDASRRSLLQSIPGNSFCMDISADSEFLVTDSGDGAQVWRLE